MSARVTWDYSALAPSYAHRPAYADSAIDSLLKVAGVSAGMAACDVGAGTGHLTQMLAARGLCVDAVEPNQAMREMGMARREGSSAIRWFVGVGEDTGRERGAYDLVTFGSSFNVVDRAAALREAHRLLRPDRWFACMWNHRSLEDPIQARIEVLIRERVPAYSYGTRREDQTGVIASSGLFHETVRLQGSFVHRQSRTQCVQAWRSHGTLARQAGERFEEIVDQIDALLVRDGLESFDVPYTTHLWTARRREA